MGGGLIELVAHGVQDIYLIGNPQISFFKIVYKRHTNFSMESLLGTIDGDINFGNKINVKIPRSGDLIHTIVLEVDLPAITSTRTGLTGGGSISYVNKIGHALIDYIAIKIGGQEIDRQYGEWMEIWTQLSMDESMDFGYQDMLQRYSTFTAGQLTSAMTVYIPLNFWFCRHVGLALPLVALQYHEVELDIKFHPLSRLYTFGPHSYYTGSKSGTTVTITSSDPVFTSAINGKYIKWNDGTTDTIGDSGYINSTSCTVASSGTKSSQEFYIIPNDTVASEYSIIDARVYIDYIYLDTYERKKFAQMKHNYLIEQVQYNGADSFTDNTTDKKFSLDFNLPVKALYWVTQYDIVNRDNDYFNYGNTMDPLATKSDIISKAVLQLNGEERFNERNAKYFRLIQAFQKHRRVPNDFIYLYSFALKPENHQPSGACNFSKIDSADLKLTFNSGVTSGVMRSYALNYNILKIQNGMGAVAFSN